MNQVMLIGHLGTKPEIRYTRNTGTAVGNFRLATNHQATNGTTGEVKKTTTWHTIVVWDRLAEACAKALKKGSKVLVDGRIQVREFEDGNGVKQRVTEIVAAKVNFLDAPSNSDNPTQEHSNEVEQVDELEAA